MIYKIFYKGAILDGFELQNVQDNAAFIFGISEAKAQSLFDGKTRCIGKGLSREQAIEKGKKFRDAGMDIILKVEDEEVIEVTSQNEINSDELKQKAAEAIENASELAGIATESAKKNASEFKEKASKFVFDMKNKRKSDTEKTESDGRNEKDDELVNTTNKAKLTLQEKYFALVNHFSFGVASVGLVVAIIFGFLVVNSILATGEQYAIDDAGLDYGVMQQQLKEKDESRYESGEDNPVRYEVTDNTNERQRMADILKKRDAYFAKVETNINEYAKVLKQQPVKEYGRDRLKRSIHQYEDYETDSWAVWEMLVDFTDDMSNDAVRLAKLEKDDYQRVLWQDALDWLLWEYKSQVQTAQTKTSESELAAMESKAEAMQMTMVAGGAFMVFFIFTMILALLKIEKNTRTMQAPAFQNEIDD